MGLPVIGNVVNLKSRQDGFASSYAGGRWMVKNPTPGTGIAGSTSLSRTAPLLAIYQTSAAGTRPLTLSTFTFNQVSTVAGGKITILFATDSTNRYDSGGTAITPGRMDADASGTTVGFTAASSPTLTADGTTD